MRASLDRQLGAPEAGGAAGGVRPSMALAAEELVRAGSDAGISWQGFALATRFQPVICSRRGECVGFEALLEAASEGGITVASSDLFDRTEPGAPRSQLDWACRALHLRNFARLDPGNRTLHLNLHPEAVARDAADGRELGGLIRYYGLVPKRVCVEIGPAPAGESLLRAAVDTYRELGVSVALDHFGSGGSNFDRAVALRPDIVKIDRKLLAATTLGRSRSRRLLASLCAMLHELGARIAVEGIETAAEAHAALDAQADFVQGAYFGAPGTDLELEGAAGTRFAEVLTARGRLLFA